MLRQGLTSSVSRASWLRRTAAASPTQQQLLRSLPGLPGPQQQQSMRCNWQYVLQKVKDKKTGKYKYEDWNDVMWKSYQSSVHLNRLIQRYEAQPYHIKPNQLKRQRKERRIYENSVKQVDDLLKYIKFNRETAKESKEF